MRSADVPYAYLLCFGRMPESESVCVEKAALTDVGLFVDLIRSPEFRAVLTQEPSDACPPRDVAFCSKAHEVVEWAAGNLPLTNATREQLPHAQSWARTLLAVSKDPELRAAAAKLDAAAVSTKAVKWLENASASALQPVRRLTPSDVENAYLVFLGREVESDEALRSKLGLRPDQLAREFLTSEEFASAALNPFFASHVQARDRKVGDRGGSLARWAIDLFSLSVDADAFASGVETWSDLLLALVADEGFQAQFSPDDPVIGLLRTFILRQERVDDERASGWPVGWLPLEPSAVNHLRLQSSDVTAGTHVWAAVGDDPVFELNTSGTPLPAGWVTLRIEIEAAHELTPSIYIDEGQGYSEASRRYLPRPQNGVSELLLHLPQSVRRIRFDPAESPGLFRLGRVHVRPATFEEAFGTATASWLRRSPSSQEDEPAFLLAAREGRWEACETLLVEELRLARPAGSYSVWLKEHGSLSAADVEEIHADIVRMRRRPLFSIVMPTYQSDERWLREAIGSVKAQYYPHWELCIADDASPDARVAEVLSDEAAAEPRMKIVLRETNGHISEATNSALALATGDFIVFMDHDDAITPDALYRFARALDQDPEIDFIYSDEDKIDEHGGRFSPFMKPDWSPEYLESCMYTAHLAAYRADIVREIGGLRKGFDGAQDYDFTLRYTEHVKKVHHLPHILYHWRAIAGSTAQSMDNKDYVIDAAVRSLQERIERTGRPGVVRPSRHAGCFDLRRDVVGEPLVSIVVPSAGRDAEIRGETVDLLAHCLSSVHEKSSYKNVEFIVVDNGDLRQSTIDAISHLPVRFRTFTDPTFNIATKMNMGAEIARGEYLLFLNDDTEVIAADWIEAMLAIAQNPGVGAVGAKLFFEDGTLQHVGVTFCEGLPDHIYRGRPGAEAGYFFSNISQREYLAVTGACILLPAEVFNEVGGFDPTLPVNYNDIDLCLSIHRTGRRIIYCPYAELFHFESISRERRVPKEEEDRFRAKWGEFLSRGDPFYSSNLEARPPHFELAVGKGRAN